MNLADFRIPGLPSTFYYIPNFITASEESSILQKIPSQRWISLSKRRLQAIPSTLLKGTTLLAAPLPPYLVNPVIDRFSDLGVFDATPHRKPNHVLVNEYLAGQGIMPHEDGAAYAPVVATISLGGSLCLEITAKERGSTIEREGAMGGESQEREATGDEEEVARPANWRILQEPRSLLVTTDAAYVSTLHGISEIEIDEGLSAETVANWELLGDESVFEGGVNVRQERISLTYRDVLKVSSAASKVFGGARR
ncbi:hypothetical protein P154DRAFT_547911 [Amniculicola lignicola CBS 123094]|uniref:Fe2OG dioxygenase domain-containing protein n=1 Tax=Amniculicola lignicola CBS 123094 TaxID=1392246 RepID=A0A6A5WBR1_9PLEO|nr:hypothetical protein P154DRAFT_547911 [Amniculicola lignicola CBS 123094]